MNSMGGRQNRGKAAGRKATRRPKVAVTYPIASDARREAGRALSEMAPMQKHVAAMLGLGKGTVSRMVSGEKSSVVSRFFDLVHDAVIDDRTKAGPLIAGAMLVAESAAATLPLDEIRRRFLEACSQEQIFQAGEDVATHRAIAAVCSGSVDEREALEGLEDAFRHEQSRHVEVIYLARAYRQARGWRAVT